MQVCLRNGRLNPQMLNALNTYILRELYKITLVPWYLSKLLCLEGTGAATELVSKYAYSV